MDATVSQSFIKDFLYSSCKIMEANFVLNHTGVFIVCEDLITKRREGVDLRKCILAVLQAALVEC